LSYYAFSTENVGFCPTPAGLCPRGLLS